MIKLSNGVVLNGRKMQENSSGSWSITKVIARMVFSGKAESVTATCSTCTPPHTDTFEVERHLVDGSVLSIGCKTFSKNDLKKIKLWLKK